MHALAPLTNGYLPWSRSAMHPAAVVAVLNDVVMKQRRRVVELGGGISTFYLARLLRQTGGSLSTVEHDADWADTLTKQLGREGLSDVVTVIHAELSPTTHAWGGEGRWYDEGTLAPLLTGEPIDLRTYRFSISWPRVQPSGRGTPNLRGLDFYKRLVDGLNSRGIKPMATLFHWDLPQALQDAGGWESRDCAKWFADYAEIVFRALGDQVPVWLTLNEPKTVVNVGYTYGAHAPGKRDSDAAQVATHHLLLAHGRAVQAFRAAGVKQRIGPALNLAPAYSAQGDDRDAPEVRTADGLENRLYLDPVFKGAYPEDLAGRLRSLHEVVADGDLKVISTPVDVLAVQYYNPVFVDPGGQYVTKLPTSIADWQQIYPEGLYDVLTRIKRDYGDIPITITENGVPRDDVLDGDRVADPERITFLRDHLRQAHRAISDGVRLESYHLWSLLDNFEWAEGYSQRWGIVYVDYASQRRVPKDSALWYRDVIARNAL